MHRDNFFLFLNFYFIIFENVEDGDFFDFIVLNVLTFKL